MKKIEIYTDGACRGNPGPGGWGALLRFDEHEQELYGFEVETTNNRMELIAAIKALQALTTMCEVDLWTDSQYVQKGMTEWLENWKARNWQTSQRKPVKNADLWQQLDHEVKRHRVQWHWVRGHAGHVENERADQLANRAIDEHYSGAT